MMKLWLIIFDISSQVSNGFAIVSAPNPNTANTDINDVLIAGKYFVKASNITPNAPVYGWGFLQVTCFDKYIIQEYTSVSMSAGYNGKFYRKTTSGNFSGTSWIKISE